MSAAFPHTARQASTGRASAVPVAAASDQARACHGASHACSGQERATTRAFWSDLDWPESHICVRLAPYAGANKTEDLFDFLARFSAHGIRQR
jgi:hypothetical protein